MNSLSASRTLVGLLAAAMSASAGPLLFTATDINPSAFTSGQAINASGAIAGTTQVNENLSAFLYRNGQVTLVPTPAGAGIMRGTSINNANVVGGFGNFVDGPDGFVWSEGGPVQRTGGAYVAGLNSSAFVGGVNGYAYMYSGGVITNINSLLPGAQSGYATAINESGGVVGTAFTGIGDQPFAYYNGQAWFLPAARGGGAAAIADNGFITGSIRNANGNSFNAFLMTNNGLFDIGTLSGHNDSGGNGVNNSAQVVGRSGSGSGQRAFLYSGGVMMDLNDLLVTSLGDGVFLDEAYGINDSGQIVASARIGTTYHTFLLDPFQATETPEPGTLLLFGGALSVLGFRKRCRR